jgi:hypothetical protein
MRKCFGLLLVIFCFEMLALGQPVSETEVVAE